MSRTSGATESIWRTADVTSLITPLELDDVVVDACIVGAGIAGLSTARALARAGKNVVVLDLAPVAHGQTERTSAHLASALDDRFYLLSKHFGKQGARLAAASHAAAVDEIERLVRELDIACDFRRVDGYLWGDARVLERELGAASEAGLRVEAVSRTPLPFDTGQALRFADQAEFEPVAYCAAIARDLVAAGGRIHRAHVLMVEDGDPCIVELEGGGRLLATDVIDATGMGITSRYQLPLRCAAYRSYVIAFRASSIPHALYWDTEDPYHYLRVAASPDGEVLLVGGSDHRVGQGDPEQAWSTLECWARERMPQLGEIVTRWSGQVLEPSDALAFIGRLPDQSHVYIVAGDSGNGLTHGVIASLLLPALIAGQSHPWAELYAPDRSRAHGIGTLVYEAMRSNLPFRDWISPADISSVDELANNTGGTLRKGLHLIAAYRDDHGRCHVDRSARCPHMHGVVRWNDAEKSWDCPVHGSRFDGRGRVLNGPSAHDLATVEDD
ncbi:MAG TPA: FAD-dependent oxidoreductase [Kofleriaceae bacterium]|nr:FAD-dependent oxidoreductase [Kofleriaceae bacterium]